MLDRRVGIVLRSSGPKRVPNPGVARFDARARSLDDDRFRDACQLQDSRSLDGGAGADADVLFVIGRESRQLDVEHVRSRRQSREAQLSFLVRGPSRRAANQRRRADRTTRARKDAALCVLDRSDERSRQPLRRQSIPQQDERRPRPTRQAPSRNRVADGGVFQCPLWRSVVQPAARRVRRKPRRKQRRVNDRGSADGHSSPCPGCAR